MIIDFVIPWVDGSDSEWIKEFNKYSEESEKGDKRICNYRDFDLLRYWFRGVEKFAPWVNKVFFITSGQKPKWLNIKNDKLIWIKHSDYMPADCVPNFNSRAIEVGINSIPGLSDYFVYFNDDFFLTDYIDQNFFFKNNLPRDMLVMTPLVGGLKSHISYSQLTDCAVINAHFNKRKCIKNNFSKFFNFVYGIDNLRNLLMLPFPYISTFLNHHFAQPFLKNTFDEVWSIFSKLCLETQKCRFRNPLNVNSWLFRYWQLMKGDFIPVNLNKERKYYTLGYDFFSMCDAIKNQKYKEIVINDSGYDIKENEIVILRNAFESILPEKCTFEI